MAEEMQVEKMKMVYEVAVTDEDIDDIMVSALESGITYWCRRAEVIGERKGEGWGHEQIARGGGLMLRDTEDDEKYELNREKFLNGLKLYLRNPRYSDMLEIKDGEIHLDTCYIDANEADSIIQLAVFGEIIYG